MRTKEELRSLLDTSSDGEMIACTALEANMLGQLQAERQIANQIQQQKCLRGKHETEGHFTLPDGRWLGSYGEVQICRHCHCLYVEKP